MAALSDPLETIATWVLGSVLPDGARLTYADEDAVDELAENPRRINGEWLWRVAELEPSITDLNTHRSAYHLELVGLWSSTGSARLASIISGVVVDVARKLETTATPDGVDLVQITGRVAYEDRLGVTAVTIPVKVSIHEEA